MLGSRDDIHLRTSSGPQNPGHLTDRLRDDEPIPPEVEYRRPYWLEGDAADYFDYLAPLLLRMKTVAECDLEAVARYCALREQFIRDLRFVREGGDTLVVRSPKTGQVIKITATPQAQSVKSLSALLLAYEREFGLTAVARSQINLTPEAAAADPLAQFIAKRGRSLKVAQ